MRILFLSLFLIAGVHRLMGQGPYANSWINYELPYFKITVKQEGVYRIPTEQLLSAAVPIGNASAENIALYYRGEEVAIRIVGAQNGKLITGSYIEFFTQGNTGVQDTLVYRPYSARPPTNYSLYSDESYYFLTINPSRKGRRLEEVAYQTPNAPAEAFHLERQVKEYRDEWSFNNTNGLVPYLQQSYYENGECWTGKMIQRDSLAKVTVALSGRVKTSAYPIQLKALINGRFDSFHLIDFMVEQRKFATLSFTGFNHNLITATVQEAELRTNDEFTLSMKSQINNQYELYSLTRYEVIYPQRFDMTGKSTKYFYLVSNPANQSTVAVEGLNASNAPIFYDVTQPLAPRALEARLVTNRWQASVPGSGRERTLFVTTSPLAIASIKPIIFIQYAVGSNYLIITHKALQSASQAYAAYRKAFEGGGYQVLVTDIEQLYDQFNYGERGPIGIRNFLSYQLSDGKKDKYLLLIGNGVSFPDVLKTWQDRDFIPTLGYPGSDVLLSAGLGTENKDTPALRTGRISAATEQQVLAYLSKVKEFESNVPTLATKNILHLSGGKSTEEITQLKEILERLEPLAKNSFLGGSVDVFSKRTNEPVENVSIAKQVNDGLGMITFMGHASPTVPDVNIGYASDPAVQLSNKGKYPFMYFNGCGVGNVFYRYETLAADWLLTPGKGAIGVLSNSFWSYSPISAKYLTLLYKTMFGQETMLGKPIGEILQKVSHDIATASTTLDSYDMANIHQLILLGDPAVVLFKINKPDYAVEKKGLFLQSSKPFAQSDSISVGFVVANAGKANSQTNNFTVELSITETNGTVSAKTYSLKAPAKRDTLFLRFKKNANVRIVRITLDAAQQIDELYENNNVIELVVDWAQIDQRILYPGNPAADHLNPTLEVTVDGRVIQNGALVSSTPRVGVLLRDDNPLEPDTNLVQVYLKSCETCVFKLVPNRNAAYYVTPFRELQALYLLGSLQTGEYELLVQGKDLNGNSAGAPYHIRFKVRTEANPLSVIVAPNPTSYYAKFIYTLYEPETLAGSVAIFNNEGKHIKELLFNSQLGDNELYWRDPQPGVYTYRFKIGEKVTTGKFTVQ